MPGAMSINLPCWSSKVQASPFSRRTSTAWLRKGTTSTAGLVASKEVC